MNHNNSFIIFDLETNGLVNSSVLSISAIKVVFLSEINCLGVIDTYNRYYFRNRNESINMKAIKINGLSDEKIKSLRENQQYPEHFIKDIDAFKAFCNEALLFIAHNISFDKSFVPFIQNSNNLFCTMKSNININKKGKWPTLENTAKYYHVSLQKNNLHNSQYDVALCFEIVKAMYRRENIELLKTLLKHGITNA